MSIPTFNAASLCSAAAVETIHNPQLRLVTETMPGADGEYARALGTGGRDIEVQGVLAATGGSPADAHQNVKALLRQNQSLADGSTVATYTGTDAASYANCVLLVYEPDSPVRVTRSGAQYKAAVEIRAALRQLTP